MKKYKEIFRLKKMLEKEGIPFKWSDDFYDGYHLCYGDVCSVIEHSFSYGNEDDKLEIMGLMTDEEKKEIDDNVLGYLTAENVFARIKKHYEESR